MNITDHGMSNMGNKMLDQSATRRSGRYEDQHGRWWVAPTENKTGDPCGPFGGIGWTAPLSPDDKYIVLNEDRRGVTIDYPRWINDLKQANAKYQKLLRDTAHALYGEKALEAIASPPHSLIDKIGYPPKQRIEPIEAAMSGNKWILGFTKVKPSWAKEFYPDEDIRYAVTMEDHVVTNQYPDDEGGEVTWGGPKAGWRLPNGEFVAREADEDKDAYKARAEALAAAL